MEKSYYQQLKPHVLKHVKNYVEDFTVHDKKVLRGYTGEFILGYRKSGTYCFLVTDWFNALNRILNGQPTDYFTENGLNHLKRGTLHVRGSLNVLAIDPAFTGMQHDRFVIGKNGQIRHVTEQTMLRYIEEMERKSAFLETQVYQKFNPKNVAA
jgi:hypothetical protein